MLSLSRKRYQLGTSYDVTKGGFLEQRVFAHTFEKVEQAKERSTSLIFGELIDRLATHIVRKHW